jgi:hypothetical protein
MHAYEHDTLRVPFMIITSTEQSQRYVASPRRLLARRPYVPCKCRKSSLLMYAPLILDLVALGDEQRWVIGTRQRAGVIREQKSSWGPNVLLMWVWPIPCMGLRHWRTLTP